MPRATPRQRSAGPSIEPGFFDTAISDNNLDRDREFEGPYAQDEAWIQSVFAAGVGGGASPTIVADIIVEAAIDSSTRLHTTVSDDADMWDVVKHAVPCEVIIRERPRRYLESHGGRLSYELADLVPGPGGVWDFLEVASDHDVLNGPAYAESVRQGVFRRVAIWYIIW